MWRRFPNEALAVGAIGLTPLWVWVRGRRIARHPVLEPHAQYDHQPAAPSERMWGADQRRNDRDGTVDHDERSHHRIDPGLRRHHRQGGPRLHRARYPGERRRHFLDEEKQLTACAK